MDAIENAFGDYVIYASGSNIKAKNLATGIIDYTSTDAATTFNNVFTALPNSGLVFVNRALYTINSDISWSANGAQLIGAGYDSGQSASLVTGTRLKFVGGSLTLSGRSARIDNMFLDGSNSSNTASDVLVIQGTRARLGSLYVWGRATGMNTVRLTGTSGSYLGSLKVDHVNIQSGGGSVATAALNMQYVTQSEFSEVTITGADTNGAIIDNSDNNHFSRFQCTSMTSTAGQNVLLGSDSSSAVYGNTFEYVAMTPDATHYGFVVNHPLTISSGQNPNRVRQYDNEGTLNILINNSAYGALVVEGIQKRRSDFTITTPAVPAGTTVGNAVQNTFSFDVEIFQTGGVGLHIIPLNGTDTTVYDTNYLRLQPGEKVYWATSAPSNWKWKGV